MGGVVSNIQTSTEWQKKKYMSQGICYKKHVCFFKKIRRKKASIPNIKQSAVTITVPLPPRAKGRSESPSQNGWLFGNLNTISKLMPEKVQFISVRQVNPVHSMEMGCRCWTLLSFHTLHLKVLLPICFIVSALKPRIMPESRKSAGEMRSWEYRVEGRIWKFLSSQPCWSFDLHSCIHTSQETNMIHILTHELCHIKWGLWGFL